MRLLYTILIISLATLFGCGQLSNSGPGGELEPRPLISSSCWTLHVQLGERGRIPQATDDSLGYTASRSKFTRSDKLAEYADKLRHRLSEKYGLVIADNCYESAAIDITLFVSNLRVRYKDKAESVESSSVPNDPTEGRLSRLHQPPPSKEVIRSFDGIMRIEVQVMSPVGDTVDQFTLFENTGAKGVADTTAARLRLPKR